MSIMQKFLALPKKVVDTVRYYALAIPVEKSAVEIIECDGKKYSIFVGHFIGKYYKDYTLGIVIKDSGNNELFNGVLNRNKLFQKS